MRKYHPAAIIPEQAGEIKNLAHPFSGEAHIDRLLNDIGDARIVMLGEASHGTHEYYTWRAKISKRLILEKGFSFIGVEGDWPDCYRVNRFVKGFEKENIQASDVLQKFNRWPTWMWANWEIAAFATWLRKINVDRKGKVGFYGLDVYSLWESMESILNYLAGKDREAYRFAQKAFDCFEPYSEDEGQSYARATQWVPVSCENDVLKMLTEIRKRSAGYNTDPEMVFSNEQNALVAVNAERYYRAMIKGGPGSWNVRDRHMSETLERLLQFHGPDSKAIIWEHNTHIGDARYTDMAEDGMVNIGQLGREKYGKEKVYLVGFGSYQGSVIAGRSWGDKMKILEVPEAREGSIEEVFHNQVGGDFLFLMNEFRGKNILPENVPHRAIGVVYHPESERWGNYVPTNLQRRYDAFIYIDKTMALHPMHISVDSHEAPETYPWGV